MSFRPVSKSKLHKNLNESYLDTMSPDPRSTVEITCRVTKVWDPATIDLGTVPELIEQKLQQYPGLLLCEVVVAGGKKLLLPLDMAPDQVYSVFGNAPLIEGRLAKIQYSNGSVSAGKVVLSQSSADMVVNVSMVSKTADIGTIWG